MDPMDKDTPPPGSSGGPSGLAPVPIPPAPSSSLSGSATAAQNASGLSKRRRGLGIVTPNACTECRKKRAKCDGLEPCSRCKSQKGVECVYEMPVRQSKDTLRRELERLKRQQRNSDSVFAALVQPELWEEVLTRLRNGHTVDNISEWLGGTLASGGGAFPGLPGRGAGPSSGFPAVASFAGSGTNVYGPRSSGLDTVSPISGQQHQHQGIRQDADQPSPWGAGPFSSHSRTVSTRSSSHADGMNWGIETIRGGRQSKVGNWLENQAPSDDQGPGEMEKLLAPEMPEMKVPADAWTGITSDLNLVQHLLSLYFCWEYPTFASLSKEHFLRDFQEGRARFCSSILVNALLALGCRFSSQPNTRSNPDDPYTSGDHFFKECQRLFCQEEDHHKLTTIQALGIMSIREASCGRDSESWYYAGQSIRLATEMGLHQVGDDGDDEDEVAVQAATFWGAFALDHAWSLATGSLPQTSCFPTHPPKPAIIDDIEASLWIPYTDDGLPLQKSCEQPSNVRSVYKCFCELSELVHQSLYILHSPGRPLTSRDLLKIYTQYLNWYDKIPEVLRLGHNFTPAVLFAHMYYHFAILLLFRPLIKLRIIGSSILPRDVCSQAANAIQGLLRSYSQLYTLRRTPSFVPYFVLTSSIMHLAIGASTATSTGPIEPAEEGAPLASKLDPTVAEAISHGIADLTEMAPCHHFAEQALNILRYLANKWKIDVDIKDEPKAVAGADLRRRAPASTRPVTSSLNFFAPNFSEQDFMCTLGGGGTGNGAMGAASLPPETHAHNVPPTAKDPMPHMRGGLDNPLFWPFPMQGRPMIPSGPLLAEAGFELL